MTIEIVPFDAADLSSPLARHWEEKIRVERNLYAMYQAPGWIACTAAALPAPPRVIVGRRAPGEPPALVAPITLDTVELRFRAARRQFASARLRCVEILGSRAVGEPTHADYIALTEQVWREIPEADGIYFKSVANDSSLWSSLERHQWRLGAAHAYRPDGERAFHYVEFPGSFEAYLGEFRKKQRYNLKRQVRLMAEGVDNTLTMELIDQPGQVADFLRDVAVITAKSWKAELDEPAPEMAATPEVLRAAATAGFLRAYLLRARGEPAAYALGYRYGDIYHYANIAYDSQFASFSPGAVLLLMMIEDLVDKAAIRFMNFGITDAGYKRVFGNRHIADASIIVMKPTLRNAALRAAHQAFESTKRALKRRTRGATPTTAAAAAEAEA